MIVIKRPYIERYLAQLGAIGNLHLYTSATRDYAIRVLKEIDPSNRLFGNRIYAQENPMHEIPKTLSPQLEANHRMVVVLDDQIRVWFQGHHCFVFPVMRYCPLFKYDRAYEGNDNNKFTNDILTYYYSYEGEGFADKEEHSFDKTENHFAMITSFLQFVYETSFINGYTQPVYEMIHDLRAKVLAGKKIFFALTESEKKDARLAAYT